MSLSLNQVFTNVSNLGNRERDGWEIAADFCLALPRLGSRTISYETPDTDQLSSRPMSTWEIILRHIAAVTSCILLCPVTVPMIGIGMLSAYKSSTFRQHALYAAKYEAQPQTWNDLQTFLHKPASSEEINLTQIGNEIKFLNDSLQTLDVDTQIQTWSSLGILAKDKTTQLMNLAISKLHTSTAENKEDKETFRAIKISLKSINKRIKDIDRTDFKRNYYSNKNLKLEQIALKTQTYINKNKLEDFKNLTPDEINNLTQMPRAFINNKIVWYHGTGSGTLPCVMRTNKLFKPTGKLRAENQTTVSGENNNGVRPSGVNQDNLSGTNERSLAYLCASVGGYDTSAFTVFHAQICSIMQRAPEKAPEFLESVTDALKEFSNEIPTLSSSKFDDTKFGDKAVELWNMVRITRLIAIFNPESVQNIFSSIQAILKENQSQKQNVYRRLLTKICNEILATPQSNDFTDQEKSWIGSSFPVVVGSDSLPQDKLKLGVKEHRERSYEGELALGKDLQYLFVPLKQTQEVKHYIKQHFNEEDAPAVLPHEIFEEKFDRLYTIKTTIETKIFNKYTV